MAVGMYCMLLSTYRHLSELLSLDAVRQGIHSRLIGSSGFILSVQRAVLFLRVKYPTKETIDWKCEEGSMVYFFALLVRVTSLKKKGDSTPEFVGGERNPQKVKTSGLRTQQVMFNLITKLEDLMLQTTETSHENRPIPAGNWHSNHPFFR